MVKEIVKDTDILTQISEPFVFGKDDGVIKDMLDTAAEHEENCVGLAAIQIGVAKRVILVFNGSAFIPMFNPQIIGRSKETYMTEEECLSLEGKREVKRHRSITVIFQNSKKKFERKQYSGLMAQIIQHECDHLNGILI